MAVVKDMPKPAQRALAKALRVGAQRRKWSTKVKALGQQMDDLRELWKPHVRQGDVVYLDDGTVLEIDGWATTGVAYEGVVSYLLKWLPDGDDETVTAGEVRAEVSRQLAKATTRGVLLYPKAAEMESASNALTRRTG